jgi:hypothetical protein
VFGLVERKLFYDVDSLGVFLRKIAFDYLRHGYKRYIFRTIPEGKDLKMIDLKVIQYYQVSFCRSTRLRRAQKGLANVVYLRYGNRFILTASDGLNEAFDKTHFLHFHQHPLLVDGYTIGVKQNKPCVMVQPRRWAMIRNNVLAIALHNQAKVENLFLAISPFSFPEVIRQKRKLLDEVNKKRHLAGLPKVQVDLRFTQKKLNSGRAIELQTPVNQFDL